MSDDSIKPKGHPDSTGPELDVHAGRPETDNTTTDSDTSQWATILVEHIPHATLEDGPNDAEVADLLECLGALITQDDEVGGAESRGMAQLVLYCVPSAVERIEALSLAHGTALGLSLKMSSEVHEGEEWRDTWKKFYQSQVWGDGRILIRPSWIERAPNDPELEIVLDPSSAFGTGQHESTQLCMGHLCRLDPLPNDGPILDLGCGSAILGLVAAKLFPQAQVDCIDIDPEAVEAALENVERNSLEERVAMLTGVVDDLPPGKRYGLILANIRPNVLIPNAKQISERLAPGGILLLSGILAGEAHSVEDAYTPLGLRAYERNVRGIWKGLYMRDVRA